MLNYLKGHANAKPFVMGDFEKGRRTMVFICPPFSIPVLDYQNGGVYLNTEATPKKLHKPKYFKLYY